MQGTDGTAAVAPREEYLELRGAKVHYFRGGSGAPLLYLRDAHTPEAWLPAHAALAERFDVIVPDHPGFGLSERPAWLEGVDDLVLGYLDLLDALGLERVHLVGVSFGGWVAAELAVLQGHRLRALVLVDAAGLRVEGAPVLDVFMMNREQLVRASVRDQALAERVLAEAAGDEALRTHLRGQETLALLAWNPYLHDPKLAGRLYRVRVPTLVVWGEDDRLIPPAHGRTYATGVPEARLEVIPACGHLPPLERPNDFARLASEFLPASS